MYPKIRLSVVSYLNSKPFIYGLEQAWMKDQIELEMDIPSVCASKLISGKVDIGLVPVAILPELKEYHLLTDYCIGANGNVNSVVLVSQVPMTEIEKVVMDYQSRTSVMLARVLAEHFWKISPDWIQGKDGYEETISKKTAGIIIGDRALILKDQFKYVYDLSGEWKKFTGLPFVFACWVSNKPISKEFTADLNKAAHSGISNIPEVLEMYGSGSIDPEVAERYLTENIDYHFDADKKIALQLFLRYIGEIKTLEKSETTPST